MRVEDVMTREVQTISPASSADEARTLMRLKQIRHLVVVNRGRISGIVSDRDLGGRPGVSVLGHRRVADLMTARVVTVTPQTGIRRAANLMRGHTIGCLVVAEAGQVVGIVTTADLLELLGRGTDRAVSSAGRRPVRERASLRSRSRIAA